jgi:hypothetical protein
MGSEAGGGGGIPNTSELWGGLAKGFFLLVPLQFSLFGEAPLQFVYLEAYHYNLVHLGRMPWNTFVSILGPATGVYAASIFLYGRRCPWLQADKV